MKGSAQNTLLAAGGVPLRYISAGILLLAGMGCDGGPPAESAGPASRIAYLRSFQVDENDEVVNVTPIVVPDPRGGLLVVDPSE